MYLTLVLFAAGMMNRAELSAVVWTIEIRYLHYSCQVQTIGEMNIGYALTSQNITF